MQVSGSNPLAGAMGASSGSSAKTAQTDKSFAAMLGNDDSPEAMLKKMTEKGISSLWSWQIDNLKQKVAEQVMKEKGVTAQQIQGMPSEQRTALEDEIMKEVEQRVKQMVADEMQKHQKDGALGISTLGSAPQPTADVGSILNITV